MGITSRHAIVVPLYGELQTECLERFKYWVEQEFWVVVVNNNPVDWPIEGVCASSVVGHHNQEGLAGGFNSGVNKAIADGAEFITLLDQDSIISSESLLLLSERCNPNLIVGPRIIDGDRGREQTNTNHRIRMLISSGTTFHADAWKKIGQFKGWMEIDYIDHEWSSRARKYGFDLVLEKNAKLIQTFGIRHPNPLAHHLGLQLYSPYRRAVSIRNLRWLIRQEFIPWDIRIKEFIKMLLKPFIWLILEPGRQRCLAVVWIGLTARLDRPFPHARLKKWQ